MKKKMTALKIAKWAVLIFFLPCIVEVLILTVMGIAMHTATSIDFDEMHEPGVRFLMKYGDKYTAYHMIDFICNKPEFVYLEEHDKAIIELAKRYPEEAENYMANAISCIMNKDTDFSSTYLLLRMLENLTGERFGEYVKIMGSSVHPPQEIQDAQLAVTKVILLNWWQKRQRDRLYIPAAD